MGANRVVYLSDTPPTDSSFKGRAEATTFITSTKPKLARAAMRAGRYGAIPLSQAQQWLETNDLKRLLGCGGTRAFGERGQDMQRLVAAGQDDAARISIRPVSSSPLHKVLASCRTCWLRFQMNSQKPRKSPHSSWFARNL